MESLKILIISCITAVYLTKIEGLNIIIKDGLYDSDFDQHVDAVIVQLQRKLQHKSNQNEIKSLSKLLGKISDNQTPGKKNLRGDTIGSVKEFLFKLNNFINKDKHNYYYEKKNDCHFGFGPPGANCKNKFRRHSINKTNRKDKINYAQHMLVERARYRSSLESDSDDDRPSGKKKLRFQIVDNAKYKKKNKRIVSSEEQDDYIDNTLQVEKTDDSDEQSSKESVQIINDNDSESDEPGDNVSDNSDKNSAENDHTDAKYMYLQGTRLQRPNFRSGRQYKENRKNLRLSHFMPKRYKWDDNMLPHLDEYWTAGIKSYDTYREKYRNRLFPY